MKFIERNTAVAAASAGIGVLQVVTFRAYIDPTYGDIPFTEALPPEWRKWSSTGSVIIGTIALAAGSLLDLSQNVKTFLQVYGVSVAVGGLTNGIFPATLGAMSRTRSRLASRSPILSRRTLPGTRARRTVALDSAAAAKRASITTQPNAPYPVKIPGQRNIFKENSTRTSTHTNEVMYTPTMVRSNKILA